MATSPKKNLRFTHVRIENWRNFSHVDVDLTRRVILIGPNASGKSNFLDVFRFLRDISKVGGGFQAALKLRGLVTQLRTFSARQQPDIKLSVKVGNEEQKDLWEYTLAFKQDKQRNQIITDETVIKNKKIISKRPDSKDKSDPELLSQTHIEQSIANKDFRELSNFFSGTHYLHIVPQLIREPDRSIGRKNDPFGGDFLEQIMSKRKDTREARLRKINRSLASAIPQLEELRIARDKIKGTPHLEGRFKNWRLHGQWQDEKHFSDGSLRLLGLLWVLLDGAGPLLLEEPELSLHSDIVRLIPQIFARLQIETGRQIIISTHAREIIDDSGVGIDEVLIFKPGSEGTSVNAASSLDGIQSLIDSGITLSEITQTRRKQKSKDNLLLFST